MSCAFFCFAVEMWCLQLVALWGSEQSRAQRGTACVPPETSAWETARNFPHSCLKEPQAAAWNTSARHMWSGEPYTSVLVSVAAEKMLHVSPRSALRRCLFATCAAHVFCVTCVAELALRTRTAASERSKLVVAVPTSLIHIIAFIVCWERRQAVGAT